MTLILHLILFASCTLQFYRSVSSHGFLYLLGRFLHHGLTSSLVPVLHLGVRLSFQAFNISEFLFYIFYLLAINVDHKGKHQNSQIR